MTKPLAILLVLSVAGSSAFADDAHTDNTLVLDEGAQLERTHRIENVIAAGVTGSLLTYESVFLFRDAIATRPSGGIGDVSELGKQFDYILGATTGVGAVTMLVLGIHDIVSSPVADAREAYVPGDRMSTSARLQNRELSKPWRNLRLIMWLNFGLDTALAGYGAVALAIDHNDPGGKASLWVGGTAALVTGTVLLHLREPVAARTYRRLSLGFTATGVVAAGTF